MVNFESVFVYSMRLKLSSFFPWGYPVGPAPYVKETLFSSWNYLSIFVKNLLLVEPSNAYTLGQHLAGSLIRNTGAPKTCS